LTAPAYSRIFSFPRCSGSGTGSASRRTSLPKGHGSRTYLVSLSILLVGHALKGVFLRGGLECLPQLGQNFFSSKSGRGIVAAVFFVI